VSRRRSEPPKRRPRPDLAPRSRAGRPRRPGFIQRGALPAAGYQDVIDLAAVVRVELFQVGPAAVAMDDRPGHAV
jgi:hypothetical protein